MRFIRPRTVLYALLISFVGLVMLVTLVTRSSLDVNVLHDRNPLFVTLSDGSIRNGYTVKILNKQRAESTFTLSVEGVERATVSVAGQEPGVTEGLKVPADKLASFRVFIAVPADALAGAATGIEITVTDESDGRTASNDSIFRGPGT